MANQYKVKAGDTLYKIARQHGISLSDLLALNPQISDPNFIQINDLINLPDSSDDNHDVDPEELDIMARTIFGEAEGESDLGKVAVGWVMMNRVAKQTWYGRDVIGVCLWPWQFSCWNPGTPRRTIIESVRTSNTHFQKCLESAKKVLTSSEPDPTGGATHYHANYISPPAWTHGATFTVQIGKHLFYKNVD